VNDTVPIFFSHSNDDRRWCEMLAADAARVGVTAYLAEHDHHAGRSLAEKVKSNIDRSKAAVVLLTNRSADSAYVQQEVGYALARRKLVIPLVQPGLPQQKLAMLQGLEYIEFDFEDPRPARESLAAELRRVAERQRMQGEMETLIALGLCVGIIVLLLHEGAAGGVSA
jgi:nucleoside 2-deoxyribosyltransferase